MVMSSEEFIAAGRAEMEKILGDGGPRRGPWDENELEVIDDLFSNWPELLRERGESPESEGVCCEVLTTHMGSVSTVCCEDDSSGEDDVGGDLLNGITDEEVALWVRGVWSQGIYMYMFGATAVFHPTPDQTQRIHESLKLAQPIDNKILCRCMSSRDRLVALTRQVATRAIEIGMVPEGSGEAFLSFVAQVGFNHPSLLPEEDRVAAWIDLYAPIIWLLEEVLEGGTWTWPL
ncbi:hypothetical protein KIPB_009562 [Kipferlia bialata]|uniref:Uncharacterized protein n=1 Tax=Kipferlia bialata TaxID=797122 RepID=A0A9K3D1T8_9EUKA|nr:hypothetical protein KIPB_009562 [Kipferlia bialata]|eukprot:g9562.t1